MRTALGLICYGLILIFGAAVAALFAGVGRDKKSILKLLAFMLASILLQSACWVAIGLEETKQLYPFIVHLPLVIFLVVCFRRSWLTATVSVLSAYLCCQIPRWVSSISLFFSANYIYYYLLYIVAICVTFYLLHRYAASAMQRLMAQSRHACMLLGGIPLFYYLFDYATTVYTDLLFSGARVAVQFMPSLVSAFYFIFVLIYYTEVQKQEKARRERDLLDMQLRQAKSEFLVMRRIEEQTRQYRHDMRHHFALLQGFAAKGDLEKIKDYLHHVGTDIDALTPGRFCENEVANLVLSYFSTSAARAEVPFTVEAVLPPKIPLSDTEFCSLLSNGLENAILAATTQPNTTARWVRIKIGLFNSNLMIQIENSCVGAIRMENGLPISPRKEHGYGSRSILAIAESHGGQASFSAGEGQFMLRVMLPMAAEI